MKQASELVVADELSKLGYELVEFRVRGTRSRQVFEVRIDRQDQQRVTVDDCARASRALEQRLEQDPALSNAQYVLEVSSPGLDRPLVRAGDWRRYVGRKALLKSAALGGRAEFEIRGVDGPEGSEMVTVCDAAGVEHRIALAEVAEARLAVHWS